MKHAALASLAVLAIACSPTPPPLVRPVAEVVAAERAFSARAQLVNVRDAFVENFAPDAIVFGPEPGPAFPGLTEGPPWGVHIGWAPADAGADCAGDLGWTTGNADYRHEAGGEVFRRGYYSSVWTRSADGGWKVLVDMGVGIPLDAPQEAEWSAPPAAPGCAATSGAMPDAAAELAGIAAALARDAESDAVAAFGARLHPQARLHLPDAAPAIGADAVRAALAVHPRLRLAQDALHVAASGDLGYSYGRGAWLDASGEQRIVYLMIWERVEGAWALRLIVQDALKPLG